MQYDESAIPPYTLPDPLAFSDGQRVRDGREWLDRRRPEILRLFAEEVYGKAPGAPGGMRFEVRPDEPEALGGKATRTEVRVHFTGDDDGPRMDILQYLPSGRSSAVPLFVGLNFFGNHSVHPDPG